MADNVDITPGTGATVAADDIGGVKHQRVKVSVGVDGSAGDMSANAGTADATTPRVTLATDDSLHTKLGSLTEGAPASDTASSGLNGRLQRIAQRVTSLIALIPTALGQNAKANSLSVAIATDDAVVGAAAASPVQYSLLDRLKQSTRIIIAAGTTLTRPANTTAYTANDSISDNATAGSVTALPVTLSSYNDDPITVERVRVVTTDTGLQGKQIAAWIYNSDPTANTGVAAGDNVAFSNKRAGFVGRMSGTFRTFSDGAVAVLVPDEGSRIATAPGASAKTLWFQFQALSDFTPSGNSTTLIATFEGFQGVA